MRRRRLVLVVPLSVILLAALIIYLTRSGSSGSLNTHTIRITRVMTSNKGTLSDETGDSPDWLELYNDSDQEVAIGGYGLSDDKVEAAKWTFPAGTTIPPHGYLVVFCSGDTARGPRAQPLQALRGRRPRAHHRGRRGDRQPLAQGGVHGLYARPRRGGQLGRDAPEPRLCQQRRGRRRVPRHARRHRGGEQRGVFINEFMASNASTLLGPDGSYCDWIELYNTTGTDIDLSGYGISDNPAQPLKYALPQGTVIRAYGRC